MVKINQCLVFTSVRDRERNVVINFSEVFLVSEKSETPDMYKVQCGSLEEKWKMLN